MSCFVFISTLILYQVAYKKKCQNFFPPKQTLTSLLLSKVYMKLNTHVICTVNTISQTNMTEQLAMQVSRLLFCQCISYTLLKLINALHNFPNLIVFHFKLSLCKLVSVLAMISLYHM